MTYSSSMPQRVMSAEEIAAKWAAESAGGAFVPEKPTVPERDPEKAGTTWKERSKQRFQLREALMEVFERYGVNPPEELVKMATEVYPDDHAQAGKLVATFEQRMKIWMELLAYSHPRLKAIETAKTIDNTLTVIVKRFDAPGAQQRIELGADRQIIDVPAEPKEEEQSSGGPTIKQF